MKKLYHHTKGKIHPSPPPPPPTTTTTTTTTDHHLSLLPIAIATLAATLPPHDQHVLAYLLSISTTTGKPTTKSSGEDHDPQFNCNCFRCYTTFWVRWDSSPNRKVIHEIIDAYEDKLIHSKKNCKSKKERKNNNNNNKCLSLSSSSSSAAAASVSSSSSGLHAPPVAGGDTDRTHEPLKMEQSKMDGGDEGSSEKGSVRKIVNFIGERIWGVWGV